MEKQALSHSKVEIHYFITFDFWDPPLLFGVLYEKSLDYAFYQAKTFMDGLFTVQNSMTTFILVHSFAQ